MADENLILYVASYGDETSAADDYRALKDATDTGLKAEAAAVLTRKADGTVEVKEHGGGQIAGGAGAGAMTGILVGLFAPPLLLATVVGAGIGAAIGGLIKRHQEKKLGVDIEEYLPVGSSAIVAIIDDQYLDQIEETLVKADKKVGKAIDPGDYDSIKKALESAAS